MVPLGPPLRVDTLSDRKARMKTLPSLILLVGRNKYLGENATSERRLHHLTSYHQSIHLFLSTKNHKEIPDDGSQEITAEHERG